MNIAINGFGRIGRSFLRVLLDSGVLGESLTLACINIGPARLEDIGYLCKYDSTMGTLSQSVTMRDNCLHIGTWVVPIIAETDPTHAPWKKYDIDWVVECSGRFIKRADAALHLRAGSRRVLISAPSEDADVCVIPGVNLEQYNPEQHEIVSLGSCTTNAFFPLLEGLHTAYQIEYGFMTTIHAYTNSQTLLDVNTKSSDVRRFRAAPQNIIPTSTGAAKLISQVFPSLTDKIQAIAIRVPLPNVSLIELQVMLASQPSVEHVNTLFTELSVGKLKDILVVSREPLVSTDYLGSPWSVTIDAALTACVGPMVKLFGWYDNEWGYSCRLRDFLLHAARVSA